MIKRRNISIDATLEVLDILILSVVADARIKAGGNPDKVIDSLLETWESVYFPQSQKSNKRYVPDYQI